MRVCSWAEAEAAVEAAVPTATACPLVSVKAQLQAYKSEG